MSTYTLENIILKWMKEAKTDKPVQFNYHNSEVYIYTSQPGYLIGKAGALYNKYKALLMDSFDNCDRVHIIEVFNAEEISYSGTED
jgi:ribosomal protein S3